MSVDALGGWVARHRAAWPAAGIIAVAVIAYWVTLSSLADYLRLDTPLAYLLMLPFFSLLLAWVTVQRYRGNPASREPQIDMLIGIPMLIVAELLVVVLPAVWSTYYWTQRPDVVSLCLFLAGSVIIFYGFTWFWRLRSSFVFIALMWPALYLNLMAGFMQSFTDGTNAVLTFVAEHLPLGVTSGAGGVLTVQVHAGEKLSVVLSTACSGANGVLGIALVGSALACVLDGRRKLKILWVVAGMAAIFVLNVLRIISILMLAQAGHPDIALGAYHTAIGLVLFTLTLILMLVAAPLFHLRRSFLEGDVSPVRSGGSGPARIRPLGSLRLPALATMAITVLLAGIAERDLGSYAAFLDGTGAPTVRPFDASSPLPSGWTVSFLATYDWASQYFGTGSRFNRYVLDYGGTNRSQAWMDVVRTDDRGALDAYNLQACYIFHDYELHTTERIDVGHGVTALLINYSDPATKSNWATVSWAWPVSLASQTGYERIALTADLTRDGGSKAPDPEPNSGLRGLVLDLFNAFGGGSSGDGAYVGADRALEGVATSMVTSTVRSST